MKTKKVRLNTALILVNLKEKNEETYDLLSLIGKMRYVVDGTRPDLMAPLGILSENGKNANWNQLWHINY